MRRNHIIIALVAGGFALAAPNLKAQRTDPPTTPDSEGRWRQWGVPPSQSQVPAAQDQAPAAQSPHYQAYPAASAKQDMSATSIIGTPVMSSSGERLGTIKDLVVNLHTHSTPFAVISSASGDKRVAVPLRDLTWSSQDKQFALNATKEQFQAASSTPSGGWMTYSDQDWTRNVNAYYGQPTTPAFTRFERQEAPGGRTSGPVEDRETIRAPSERKGATDLQPSPSEPEAGTMTTPGRFSEPTDTNLRSRVDDVIRQNPRVQSSDVQVQVNEGVVTLSGEVPDAAQKRMIESQVRALPGVERVQNNLIPRNP